MGKPKLQFSDNLKEQLRRASQAILEDLEDEVILSLKNRRTMAAVTIDSGFFETYGNKEAVDEIWRLLTSFSYLRIVKEASKFVVDPMI